MMMAKLVKPATGDSRLSRKTAEFTVLVAIGGNGKSHKVFGNRAGEMHRILKGWLFSILFD